MNPLRIAVVMPPVNDLRPEPALDLWSTFTTALEALQATGTIEPIGCCRTTGEAVVVERNGVRYHFESSSRRLARRVADLHPAVVHVHGLGFSRLLLAIRQAAGRDVPILLQHHGEPPPARWQSRIAQRMTRHLVAGYLFTGASGQAEAFRRAGVISRDAPVFEVLESASHLDGVAQAAPVDVADPDVAGRPCVLWVGRLIPSKDPLCALRATAAARRYGSRAQLHMVATDRTMEPQVRSAIESLNLNDIVHIHPAVPHADMPGWYSRADVYLSTSHREGSNYSLIEALGFGCLPVVTDIPSHAAIVKDLARRFAVSDYEAAGELIAAEAAMSRDQIIAYSNRVLSWRSIADQLALAYVSCAKA
jgi:glycosyltransferase involved in cell wall biosynthesis